MFFVGPQYPFLAGNEWAIEQEEGECKAYLDGALAEEGEKSVLYIRRVLAYLSLLCLVSDLNSFGSILFAPTKDQLILLLDVLEDLGRKFILVVGNLNPEVRPGIEEVMLARVGKGKNKGLLAKWAPQRTVLSHPASHSRC